MTQTAARNPGLEYLRMKVMTASPEQLQMMLFDGAIRFARQGREAMAAGDLETACDRMLRAQKIVLEMRASLRRDVEPDLVSRVDALYTYIYGRLLEANFRRDVAIADEAIKLLDYQRQTWQMLIDRVRQSQQNATAPVPPVASSLNIAV